MVGPGVSVSTSVQSGPGSALQTPSSRFFVAGLAERGDAEGVTRLLGMADYEAFLGARVTYGTLYDQLRTFFSEGGKEAYVARTVGPAATKGTLMLVDRAVSPLSTLKVDAQNAGAWSSGLTVQVLDGSIANTFRIVVRLNGVVVEDRTNLASPTAAVTAFAASPYVRLTSQGSATAAPNNNPAVLAATPVSAGTDDRASVNTAGLVAALDRFGPQYGDGAVAIPGQSATAHAGILAHAAAHRRIALLADVVNANVAALLATAGAVSALPNAQHAGLFAPWINVDDDAGGFRQISPEGYVAAVRTRAHEQAGPWRAPAGLVAAATTVLGLAQVFTKAEAEQLDAGRVSVVRAIADSVRLYGWRSLSANEDDYGYLSAQDLLNRLVVEGEDALEEFVFQPIDAKGQLLASVNASIVGIAEAKRSRGALYENVDPSTGRIIDPGYRVETGASVNSAASLAQNRIKARLSVRVAPTGALVELTIVKIGVLSGL